MRFVFVTQRLDSVDMYEPFLWAVHAVEPAWVDLGKHLEVISSLVGELRYLGRLKIYYSLYVSGK